MYTGDCGPSQGVIELVRNSDLMLAEATYVRNVVRQGRRLDVEWAGSEVVARVELDELIDTLQLHAGSIESQHRIERPGQSKERESRPRSTFERPGAQQRAQVGAVIWVTVADEDSVNCVGRHHGQQSRCRGIARVDEQSEPGVLNEVPAARLTCGRPSPATSENGEFHVARAETARRH
jgi:hypothetical protein